MSSRNVAVAAIALLAAAATPALSASVSTQLAQKASASVNLGTSGCTNNPGPFITLNGEIRLGGVNARIILSNNAKLTHTASTDVVADVVLVPQGQSIQIAKQPSQGGVGGNPWIYFQFNDANGTDLTQPVLLGRCVQGLSPANLGFVLSTAATASVVSGQCSNNPGPYVTLDGELKLGGLGGRIILTNNAKFTHVAATDVVLDIVLLQPGQSITFHKQPPLGGAGGNPWIFLQFLDGQGNAYGSPILVGRCNQL